jgi:hypothetical protein
MGQTHGQEDLKSVPNSFNFIISKHNHFISKHSKVPRFHHWHTQSFRRINLLRAQFTIIFVMFFKHFVLGLAASAVASGAAVTNKRDSGSSENVILPRANSTSSASTSTATATDSTCTNSASARSCWGDGFDIDTDSDLSWPVTGNTVSVCASS